MKPGTVNQNNFDEWLSKCNLTPSAQVSYNYQQQLSIRNHYLI